MKRQLFISYMVLLVAILYLCGCGQKEAMRAVDFNNTVQLKETQGLSQKPAINVCIGSMITPQDGYEYYKRLLDYLAKRLDMAVNFIDRNSYAEVNALLKEKNVDVAFVCGGPYVDGHKEFGLELFCGPQVNGEVVYYSYIIVSKDSPIQRLEDLRGKRFAFVDPMSNTGKAAPAYIIKKEFNEEPEDFFKECVYTYDHDKSIRAVSHNLVDAAAVDSLIWNYMDKKGESHVKKTRIIRVSDAYGIPPVVSRPGLDPGLKAKIKDILLNMHEDKEGSDILSGMFIDKFVEVDDSNYDSIRQIRPLLEK